MKITLLLLAVLLAAAPARALRVFSMDSKSPLVHVRVMVRGGSAMDPPGLEGLAGLTAELMIEGGFGDPQNPVTKEKLAELTRPWGSQAMPSVAVSKEVAVFSFTIPREVLDEYLAKVLVPMFNKPLFDLKELERVRAEQLQELRSGLRLERIEDLGLAGLDNLIHDKTRYAHPPLGTESGLKTADRYGLMRFYRTYYRPEFVTVGLGSPEKAFSSKLEKALANMGQVEAGPFVPPAVAAPAAPQGRKALIVALPNAISTGLHAGFPLVLSRKDKEFWPLYVGNVWLGAHRDGFSHLYEVIREQRGYNYGDYSYVEHFESRPEALFPPFATPRRHEYFSIWVRPVAHAYAAHVLRAVTWELEEFIRAGLTEEQCRLAKNKARVLYLSLADTAERLLDSALDDDFYGMSPGYLPGYLARVDAVTCDEVNAAIRKHLQAKDLSYLAVTAAGEADKLAAALATDAPVWGKGAADYQIDVKEEDGKKLFLVPEPRLEMLQRDALWAHEPLRMTAADVRILPVERLFEGADLPLQRPSAH